MVVRMQGRFDEAAVTRLAGWLAGAGRGDALVLDFSAVGAFEDFCLGRMASDIAERSNVVVRGLSQHHVRMLRYLGFERGPAAGELASRLLDAED